MDDHYTKDEILRIAASAEKLSEHPLGKAIVACCEGKLYDVQDFKVIAGRGITAVVQGKSVLAGKRKIRFLTAISQSTAIVIL